MEINNTPAYYAWIEKDGKKIFCFCTKEMTAVKLRDDIPLPVEPFEFIEQPFQFIRWGTSFDV